MIVHDVFLPIFLAIPLISQVDNFNPTEPETSSDSETISRLEKRIEKLENQLADLIKTGDHKVVMYHQLEGFERPEISQSISALEFDFELRACERHNKQVSCLFTVKNSGDNATLSINQETKFYDQQGREYRLSSARIVDKKATFPGPLNVEKEAISGIPIDMTLTFNNVPLGCTRIAMLNVEGHLRKGRLGSLSLEYKNIGIVIDTAQQDK